MYRNTLLAVLTCWLAASTVAQADVRREVPARRPYILEVGEPYPISKAALRREAQRNEELRTALERLGEPDYAEIQELRPEWPWQPYEVRLYYLRWNLELDFGRAITIEGAYPDLGVLKFQGGIPMSKRVEIEARLAPPPEAPPPAEPLQEEPSAAPPAAEHRPTLEELAARVEAAAERAAIAAEQAVERSQAAERAADRTVTVVDRLLQETEQRR